MRQPGRALVGHQERPAASASVPLPFAPLRSRSHPLSRSRAAAAAPPHAIAADAHSSSPYQLWPPPSSLRPRARAQPRSLSLARPVELTERVGAPATPRSARFSLSFPPFLASLVALAPPWLCAPIPAVSARSTTVRWSDHGEQRRRSAMAGVELAPICCRPRKRVRRIRLES